MNTIMRTIIRVVFATVSPLQLSLILFLLALISLFLIRKKPLRVFSVLIAGAAIFVSILLIYKNIIMTGFGLKMSAEIVNSILLLVTSGLIVVTVMKYRPYAAAPRTAIIKTEKAPQMMHKALQAQTSTPTVWPTIRPTTQQRTATARKSEEETLPQPLASPVRVLCPSCGHKFDTGATELTRIKCPKCGVVGYFK